jgi:hypothetical protein
VETKPFVIIALTLVVLIVLAVWQFYSLAWGDGIGTSHTIRSAPSVAASPK